MNSAPRSLGHRLAPRRAPRGRFPLAGVLGLLVAVGVAVALLVQSVRARIVARAAFPHAEGRFSVSGISSPIEIFRDNSGVPHIEAGSQVDAFFGLGFVHAQDRLAQMMWLASTARGRSAEVIGAKGLPADRLARLLDISGLARAEVEKLDAQTRELLEAYAAGVNARIERIRKHRVAAPLATPRQADAGVKGFEPWTPETSLAILKQYAWGLSGTLDVTLVLSDVVEHLGRLGARPFFPRSGDEVDPDAGGPALTAGISGRSAQWWSGLVPDPLRRAAGLEGRNIGSSAWVIGGAHTESGRPILVGDAHLPPTAPPLFHIDHVRGGGLDVAGSTLPGVPLMWTGTNGRVTWASTHARAVTTDLYEETVHPEDPNRYHDGKGWREFTERVESIRVRDGREEVLTIRSSRHGPLLPQPADGSREPISLAWAGARRGGTSTLVAFLAVARAENAEALVEALRLHHDPPLTVVYADKRGGMGLQVAGWIPRREFSRGLVPLPGRARWYEWNGRIAFDDLPHVGVRRGKRGAPASGWLIAADNRLLPRPPPVRIEWLWRSGERAARIDELLRERTARGDVELRGMAALQTDEASVRSRSLVLHALGRVEGDPSLGDEAREVAELLQNWDGVASAGSAGAAIYHVFLERLTEKILTLQLGEELGRRYVSLPQADPAELIHGILEPGGSAAWERIGTGSDPSSERQESADEIIRRAIADSMRETWLQLSFDLGPNRSRWHWGRLHSLRFAAFRGSSGSDGLSGLGPFSFGGNGSTINAAEYAAGGTFDVRVASTFRFAIDASALDEALVALAPGQSEHPHHPHFTSGLARWLQGRPSLLATSTLLVEEASASRLTLDPEV